MEASTAESPQLVFEGIDPNLLGVDDLTLHTPQTLGLCLKMGSQLLPEPSKVSLVIASDFIASVQARIGDPTRAADFNLERGTGVVGAKTMFGADGAIDIILHGSQAELGMDPVSNSDGALWFLRTVIHEYQHAAMYQRKESFDLPKADSWKMQNLESAANGIIDEFRAERGTLHTVPEEDTSFNLDDIAEELSDSLIQTVMEYQEHHEVGRLVYEVGSRCLISWKALAFATAFFVERQKIKGAMSRPVSKAWKEMCGDHWEAMVAILQDIPGGSVPCEKDFILGKVRELSLLLDRWLRHIGFEWDEPMFKISPKYISKLDEAYRLRPKI